ncbi:predicted protein [Uncinocarpus reesii 1704]|uniref:Uncharacterized protein n=1 Tax=Uncinocarpus reesii (strain UAMH 1704) TaxID=336963 RepID=C4JVR4_UNCRE|nr:uncharacterized protein UREG_06656 [Uncinocarpus reesii 1704]EEP81791.1 predicted protein [Uncinocarpus reesii 1704]
MPRFYYRSTDIGSDSKLRLRKKHSSGPPIISAIILNIPTADNLTSLSWTTIEKKHTILYGRRYWKAKSSRPTEISEHISLKPYPGLQAFVSSLEDVKDDIECLRAAEAAVASVYTRISQLSLGCGFVHLPTNH